MSDASRPAGWWRIAIDMLQSTTLDSLNTALPVLHMSILYCSGDIAGVSMVDSKKQRGTNGLPSAYVAPIHSTVRTAALLITLYKTNSMYLNHFAYDQKKKGRLDESSFKTLGVSFIKKKSQA